MKSKKPRFRRSVEAVKADAGGRPAKQLAARPDLVFPSVLFEGDLPAGPTNTGTDTKDSLKSGSQAISAASQPAHLPSSYRTGRLFLVARDPHWLYARWDITEEQQRHYNSLSADLHLVMRIIPGTLSAHDSTEIHVHPESRHWFIHVDGAGTKYTAQLGYYRPDRKWVAVASPASAATPRDTFSTDRTLRFATFPIEKPLRGSLMRAPRLQKVSAPAFEQSHERSLAQALSRYFGTPQSPSSADVGELVRGALEKAVPAEEVHLETIRGAGLEGPSSPLGGLPAPDSFWFNLNAELVLYGATAPDASLAIGGYRALLRPDGTFSVRFALPDGDHEVVLSAMSAGGDYRQAVLKFRRCSEYQGQVGAHPQDPALTAPPAENA